MIRRYLTLLLLLLISTLSISQNIRVDNVDSYQKYLEKLKNSKDLMYQDVLKKYDKYIKNNPYNITVQVYRCKFIGNAFYNESEGYDENYDETESCINALYESYSKHPEVLLYKLEYTYGDGREDFIKQILVLYEEDKSSWSDKQISSLYKQATYYYQQQNFNKVILFANKAEKFNDSLDLSIEKAKAYLELGNKEMGKEIILSNLSFDSEAWILSQKAELLLKFDENEEALKMFERLEKKDSTYSNNQSLYKIFLEKKEYDVARNYLVKDTLYEWNKEKSINKLLEHDLSFSDRKTALNIYRKAEQYSFYNDFFGIDRLRLFFKGEVTNLTFTDVIHVLIFIFSLLLILIIPYLWVLPVHFIGNKLLKNKIKSVIPFNWDLKHFWLISFVYILISFLLLLFFDYHGTINYFFTDYYVDDVENIPLLLKINFWYILLMFISTLFFLNRDRVKYLYISKIGFLRTLSLIALFILVNYFVLKFLKTFIDISYIPSLNIREVIKGLIQEKGLFAAILFVSILVPIYEEVIFRGIIFSSIEKHIGFWVANTIQASLFALIHDNLSLFLYYFVFGFMLGVLVKRSKGLFTGIVLHAINNSIAVIALYYIMKFQDTINSINEIGLIILP